MDARNCNVYNPPVSGQKGFIWHVSVATIVDDHGEPRNITFYHLFDKKYVQDSGITTAIILDVMACVNQMNSAVTDFIVTSNNASVCE